MAEANNLKIIETSEINQELNENSPIDVIAPGALSLPYNLLSPDQFELLLWDIFHSGYETNHPYDHSRLMAIGADQGRDVWLTNNGIPIGLIQCKREAGKFSVPATIKEILKFLLYAEIDHRLLPQPEQFTFYLALSSDPQGGVDDFFENPNNWIDANSLNITKVATATKRAYASFKDLNIKELLPTLIKKMKKFQYSLLRPHEVNRWLQMNQDVRTRHFLMPNTSGTQLTQVTANNLKEASSSLYCWHRTIENRFIKREELDHLKQLVQTKKSDCYLLIGNSGSGKSSILSELYTHLLKQDLTVLAIKADELDKNINDLTDLAMHLKLDGDISKSLLELSDSKPLVLLIDQMDAVSEVMDQSSSRFRVLIELVLRLKAEFDLRQDFPIHIILSSRPFEASFDSRFTQLRATPINLDLPSKECIEEFLTDIDVNKSSIPASMYPTIQSPFALSLYVSLIKSGENPSQITSKNLLSRWLEKKLTNSETREQQKAFLHLLAKDMVEHEVLRRPIEAYRFDHIDTINSLEAVGIIVKIDNNIGFSHQAWLDDFQAQGFSSAQDIVQFIMRKQDGLFSRSTVLRGLEYLREHNINEYHSALDTLLFNSEVRRHILHLLVDIISTSKSPDFDDVDLISKIIMNDQVLAGRIISKTATNWRNWRELLLEDLPILMKNPSYSNHSTQWLIAESNFNEEHMVSLIDRIWDEKKYDELAFNTLYRSMAPSSAALKRIEIILSRTDVSKDWVSKYILDLFKQQHTSSALKLLQTWIEVVEDNALINQQFYGIETHVEAIPLQFSKVLMPWFIHYIESDCAKTPSDNTFRRSSYLSRNLTNGSEKSNLLSALQLSLIESAKNVPYEFLRFIKPFLDIKVEEVQSIIATAFASNPNEMANEIEQFLLEDNNRLCLGDAYFKGEDHVSFSVEGSISIILIEEAVVHWNSAQINRVREAIEEYEKYILDKNLPVAIRRHTIKENEAYRLTLLARLPTTALNARRNRQVIERDTCREPKIGERSKGMGVASIVCSPVSAKQMAKANINDVLKLLSEVIPRENRDSYYPDFRGKTEIPREFGNFAQSSPAQAYEMMLTHFATDAHERAAAYAIVSISKSKDISINKLKKLITILNQRGFNSKEWVIATANAFQELARRDNGLNTQDIDLLTSYLNTNLDSGDKSDYTSENSVANEALLFGTANYSRLIPSGNYTILVAIYLGLLCRENPDNDQWLETLSKYFDLPINLETWECILVFQGEQLFWANSDKLNVFITRLFTEKNELFSTTTLIRTIWTIREKLDFPLLSKIIGNWQSSDKPNCIQAAAELMSGDVIYNHEQPKLADMWLQALKSDDTNIKLGGIYTACSGWYTLGKTRGLSHQLLISCMKGELKPLSYAINTILSFNKKMPSDELTYELLDLISNSPSLISKLSAYRLLNSLKTLNPTRKMMNVILRIAQHIVKSEQDKGRDFTYFEHAESLVELAVTLQRTNGSVKEEAMVLYETLLDAGTYQAEQAAEAALRSY